MGLLCSTLGHYLPLPWWVNPLGVHQGAPIPWNSQLASLSLHRMHFKWHRAPSTIPSWLTFELLTSHPLHCKILSTHLNSSIIGPSMAAPKPLMYYQCNWPTLCLGWLQSAASLPLQLEPHQLMVRRVVSSTLVSTINQRVSNVCTNVVALVGTWLVTTGCPVGIGISILAISIGPKEIVGDSRIMWSESNHSTDMIYCICNIPSKSNRADGGFIINTICGMMKYLGYRNPLSFNTLVRVNHWTNYN